MVTFDLTLSDTWQEVLNGGTRLAFDVLASTTAHVYLSETADNPGAASGNAVQSWTPGFDFQASGMTDSGQRIWVKGSGDIRGVRG
jgi:hypothetical protein